MSAPLYDADRAQERITTLEREAMVHEEKGQVIQAGTCRSSIRVLRALWGIPGGGGP